MKTPEFRHAADAFRSMHHGEMLVLPNAWDALSARVFAEAGCKAIATTSAGVAWSLGYPDGERVPWKEFLATTGRIARVLSVPLTVDFESGFSTTSAGLAEHVRALIGAGAAGVNLEDSRNHAAHGLFPLEDAAELRAPVNIMLRPGAPTLNELRAAGVARVSTATGPVLLTAGVLMGAIVRLKETGSAEHFASPFTYPRMQKYSKNNRPQALTGLGRISSVRYRGSDDGW